MRTPHLPRSQAGLVLLLGSMTALGAVAGDIYLPSLPDVIHDLDTTRAWAQSTITCSILGVAIGQLLVGPVSDRYGRRGPVLVGVALHVAASIGIVFTPSIWVLLVLRVLQGVGAASAGVVAMAVIRDLHSGYRAARLLSQLVLVIGVAPLFAPTLGTALAQLGTWRYNFVFLAALGVVLGLFVLRLVPDTRNPETREAASGLGASFKAYGKLLRDGRFMAFALIPALAQASLMSWVISSPFLIQVQYGQGPVAFSILFALCGLFMVAGAQTNASVVHRFKPETLLRWVLPVELMFAATGLVLTYLEWGGLVSLIPGICCLLFANGFVPGNASALALSRHGEAAGAASALIGTLQAGVSAGVMGLLSALGDSQREMTLVQTCALAAALIILVAGGVYRRGHSPRP